MHSIQCPLIAQRIRRTGINSNNWRLSVLFSGEAESPDFQAEIEYMRILKMYAHVTVAGIS